MKARSAKSFLLAEVVLCFALPAYFLFWGLVTLPLWLLGAGNGATYALIHALCTIGGWTGLVALAVVMRYVLRTETTRVHWLVVLPLIAIGIVSIWTTMTGQFEGFQLNWFSLLSTVAPTLATVHVLWVAMQRHRHEPPNNAIHATCEDSRA